MPTQLNKIILRYVYVITVCLSVASCGFSLRHTMPLPTELHSIHLSSAEPYGKLTIQLAQILKSLHVNLMPQANQAQLTLRIFNESYKNRVLSESASSATKQYTLTYKVAYDLRNTENKILYGPKTISAFRNYMVNEGQVLSTPIEKEILITEIQRDIAYQLLAQLSSTDVQNALAAQQLDSNDEVNR